MSADVVDRSTRSWERHRISALVVGSRQGDVVVVRAQTGARLWRQQTGHDLGTLTQDGVRFYLSLGASLSLQRQLLRRQLQRPMGAAQLSRLERLQEQEERMPTPLTGRRLEDGSLVWTHADWRLTGSLHVEVDGDTLFAASCSFSWRDLATQQIYALDTTSGRVLWTTVGDDGSGYEDRLVTACGGRVFVHKPGAPNRMQALEARTGRELWSTVRGFSTLFYPRGVLVAQTQPSYVREGALIILRAEDGTQACQIPFWGRLKALTDEGMAYAAGNLPEQVWVAAVDATSGGRELWHAEGVRAHTVALDSDHLYYASVRHDALVPHRPYALAEVGALDARTGAQLWTWHSPQDTGELLRLWGGRTPGMLVDSAKKSWEMISTALTYHGPRETRRHELRIELSYGQWRYPYTLNEAANALWLEARDGLVFVETRLGLFALDGSSGTLKWHRLPDVDLSFVEPALPPL